MIDLRQGDCLELMPAIPDHSIDLILCDLPYGTTACRWDTIIPFELLWVQYKRVIKGNGAIVLTASQPFTSALVMSNIDWFRYCLVWDKCLATGHLDANRKPLKRHEDICVFYAKLPTYNPQKEIRGKPRVKGGAKCEVEDVGSSVYHAYKQQFSYNNTYFPTSIIVVSNANRNTSHPTQKPVALMEYLIQTYTNLGETVLDNCMGFGTTGVACVNLQRNFIGMELDPTYFALAQERIKTAAQQLRFTP